MKLFTCSIALVVSLFYNAFLTGQEKANKPIQSAQMVSAFMKQLEKAQLKDEQANQIKEMYTKVAKEVAAKRTEAGITSQMLKKRTDAAKEAREAGKKPKEVQAVVEAAVEFSESQKKVMTETDEVLQKVKIEIGKLLKPEQIEKLPTQLQNNLKEKPQGKKNRKDKASA